MAHLLQLLLIKTHGAYSAEDMRAAVAATWPFWTHSRLWPCSGNCAFQNIYLLAWKGDWLLVSLPSYHMRESWIQLEKYRQNKLGHHSLVHSGVYPEGFISWSCWVMKINPCRGQMTWRWRGFHNWMRVRSERTGAPKMRSMKRENCKSIPHPLDGRP